jgi:folate-binding protein YgfZ
LTLIDPNDAYWAARKRVAWADRSNRERLAIYGPDRARFVHNLTTNEVKRLIPGQGCEAFVTNLRGKTLGFVTVHVAEERILLRSDPRSLETLLPHLSKYGAVDDVVFNDLSADTFELHLCSPALSELLARLEIQAEIAGELTHTKLRLGGGDLLAIREDPTGVAGLTLIGEAGGRPLVVEQLTRAGHSLGLLEVDPATFDVLRIEALTPVFGRDITEDNLPQEVGRDRRAINFVKGCYLGQETVARIDALGHVNNLLRGIRLEDAGALVPEARSALELDGKQIGTITSAAFSPGWQQPVCLAYLRTGHDQPGTTLRLKVGGEAHRAVVSDSPMLPP